ncbi:MAG: DUF366 family protein [Firmicutes bacterium]|nr:DUF366 family protein [Bacillota bacterium]
MHVAVLEEPLAYDGRQLSALWAFRTLGLQGDSIVGFRGPCAVEGDRLVDLADARAGARLYSPDMLHFIAEHFHPDLEKAVLCQRLLVALVGELLAVRGRPVRRHGDDLFYAGRKLSVSIATVSRVSALIHLGLNVDAAGAPVPAVGLLEMGFAEGELLEFARTVCRAYAGELEGAYLARCKVRAVE